MGSEDSLQFFLKGIFIQEGSSGTHFDHGQFEIKTFPIYAPPYYTCTLKSTLWDAYMGSTERGVHSAIAQKYCTHATFVYFEHCQFRLAAGYKECMNYRLITAYLLLRVNLDKIMHAR